MVSINQREGACCQYHYRSFTMPINCDQIPPHVTSRRICDAITLAYSVRYNPRALESEFYPAFNQSLCDLTDIACDSSLSIRPQCEVYISTATFNAAVREAEQLVIQAQQGSLSLSDDDDDDGEGEEEDGGDDEEDGLDAGPGFDTDEDDDGQSAYEEEFEEEDDDDKNDNADDGGM